MIRILYVDHVSQLGGAQISLLTLLRGLDRRRFEPHVALPALSGPFAQELAKLGVPVHEVPLGWLKRKPPVVAHLASICLVAKSRAGIGKIIEELDPQIIHANSTSAQAACAWFAHSPRRRVIWHIRDMTALGAVGRFLAARADLRIAPSSPAAEFHKREHPASSPIYVVPNGIDTERFSPEVNGAAVRRELGVPDDAVLFGSIGQAVAWKRLGDLLEVNEAIAADERVFRLIVAADPFGHAAELVAELKRRAADIPRCIALGWRDDIERVIAALDVLVHPAEAEAFGRTVAEAMACGKPVIAADRGGPGEIVRHGETGLLFPPGDVQALAEAMRRLAADPPLRRQMGVAGRRRAVEEYSAEGHVRRMEAVYEQVLTT